MGSLEVEACVQILDDHFGPVVAAVGEALLEEPAALPGLMFRLRKRFRVPQVKRSLVILEQHNVLKFEREDRKVVYLLNCHDILRLPRFAQCSLTAKTLYGEAAEATCEELFSQGRLTCSECIRRVAARLELPTSEVKEKFARLTESQLVIRCPKVESNLYGCPVYETLHFPFMMPDAILGKQTESKGLGAAENESRKRKLEKGTSDPDSDIYWKIHFPRFERYLRDEMVAEAIDGEYSNAMLHKVVRTILKSCELKTDSSAASSFPISVHEIVRFANSNDMNLEHRDIDTALKILSDGQRIVRKVGDSAGGLYVIDFENAINLRCQRLIESVIREKIDTRGVRIFRLLLQKGYLSEEQIEKLGMLSAKEAKELCYDLIGHGFVSIRHVGKSSDFNTAKTVYLYHVDISKAAHALYLETCKVLRNVIIRRKHETKEHRSLIERNLKRETIIATIQNDAGLDDASKEQQIAEVEETYMTNEDRANLEKYKQGQNALLGAEIELDKDLLLLSLYIQFARLRL